MIATRSLWLAIVKDLLLLCEELILELEDLERQCKNCTFSSLQSTPRAFLVLGNSLVCTFLLLDLVLHVADFLEFLLEVDEKLNMIVMRFHSSLDAFVEVLIAGVFVEVIKWKVRAGTKGGCF